MKQRDETLELLRDSLPAATGMADGEMPNRARAVLGMLMERVREVQAIELPPVPEDPNLCPNCDRPNASPKSPYCCDECREAAGLVRQVRAGLDDASILDPERQVAFGQVLWHAVGGGRPLRRHIIPERSKIQTTKREGDRCWNCGEPAVSFDHIGSGCNRSINLRPVCEACSKTKDFGDPELLGRHEAVHSLSDLAMRIASANALRCCDDAATWDWRAFLKRRAASIGFRRRPESPVDA